MPITIMRRGENLPCHRHNTTHLAWSQWDSSIYRAIFDISSNSPCKTTFFMPNCASWLKRSKQMTYSQLVIRSHYNLDHRLCISPCFGGISIGPHGHQCLSKHSTPISSVMDYLHTECDTSWTMLGIETDERA